MSRPEAIGDRKCPICGKASERKWHPFCSKRCADVDLNRWLSGVYTIPAAADEDEIGIAPRPDADRD